MKPLFRVIILLSSVATLARSQQATPIVAAEATKADVIEVVPDGKPVIENPKPEPIAFEVVHSKTQEVHVVKAPEMSGLPAIEGNIKLTVELVKNPGLPDPPPLPALKAEDPAVVARLDELASDYPETQLVFVSASVHKKRITQFRIQGCGKDAKEISGWSNIDFNLFSGFTCYQANGTDGVVHEYGLVMGIGEAEQPEQANPIPLLPDLATQGPSYVLTGGDIKNPETRAIIEGIHNLYKAEGPRLVEAYRQRIKAEDQRRAFLLAHPPKPQDVTIRFWNRENAAAR